MDTWQQDGAWQQAILDSADYIIIATDPQGIIRTFNAGALRQLGYCAEEVIGKRTPAFLHDSQEMAERARQLAEELGQEIEPGFEVFVAKARLGVADENTWTYIRRDGSRFNVRLSVTRLLDESGELRGFLGIGKDWSAQMKAEAALQESESRFHRLAEATFEAIVISEQDRIVDANSHFTRLYGYERAELIGMGCENFIGGPDKARIIDLLHRAAEEPFVFQAVRKDGTEFTAEARCKLFTHQGRCARVTALHDITERHRLECSLRAVEARYRDLFDNANDLIQSAAPDGRLLFVNRAWREALGYSEEEIPHISLPDIIHPSLREHCMELFRQVLQGENLHGMETVFVAKNGREIVVEGSSNAHFENGVPVSTRSIFRDITQRKRDEQQIAEQRRKLEEANAQLQFLAITDSLTGLWNRRAFEDQLAMEFDRFQRHGDPLSLLILDVDRFKQHNDRFGHLCGDEVLRRIAQLLTTNARSTDVAARYGGEEFALIMPATDCNAALHVAERIRQAIQQAVWPGSPVTASLGAATFSESVFQSRTADVRALVDQADKALYQSKREGRNRVSHADHCPPEPADEPPA